MGTSISAFVSFNKKKRVPVRRSITTVPTIPIVLKFKPSTSSAKGIAQSSSFSIASLSSGMARLISFCSFSGEVSDKSRVELSSSEF